MPRPHRHFIPQVPVHIVQRGHSKESIFYSAKDYAVFRKALLRAASKSTCHVHAYALMTNHIHILLTPQTCLLYTSPSPRDQRGSRMPSSA